MNTKSGRVIVACCLFAALAGLGIFYSFGGAGAGAAAQALPDTGKFKVGSTLGHERAGFSGRAMVQVFTTADSPDWPAISACLQSAEVQAEMGFFVGVLVDAIAEPGVEDHHRQVDGLQVVVRGLNGGFLGGLPAGFTCLDLVGLLQVIRAASNPVIHKSPIYASLMDSPAAVDYLILNGEGAKAVRFVELLEEFEGSNSVAVLNAKARLNR